ncbi:MAG: LptF/LptG family permease [Bacteroidetes bacterium]|nr:LptF/LptG family permease [Bacteroidota bacterium]
MLLLLSAIIVVFDISQKVDDFIQNNASLYVIMVEYYANFLPSLLNTLLPLFIFVSVIFFTSRMANQSEFIAILNSGAGISRILRPYMVFATICTILSIYLYNQVIPDNQKRRWKFENQYISPNRANVSRNIHRQIAPNVYVYMESFLYTDSMAYRFSMDKLVNKKLVARLTAQRILWNKEKKKWTLENYVLRKLLANHDVIVAGNSMDTSLNFNPKDFIVDEHLVEQLDYKQLNDFIKKEQMRGADTITWYLLEKYQRFSTPFSSFILTIIGFCVSFRKSREGIGGQLLIGLGLSFSYILLMRFTGEFAKNDLVPVWLAVWIPNMIYSVVAVWLFIKARR